MSALASEVAKLMMKRRSQLKELIGEKAYAKDIGNFSALLRKLMERQGRGALDVAADACKGSVCEERGKGTRELTVAWIMSAAVEVIEADAKGGA